MTDEQRTATEEFAKSMGGVAIRGVITVKAGNRVGEGTVSTYMDLAKAQSVGIGKAGTITAYLDLDTIEALAEEAGLHPMAVGTLVMTNVELRATKWLDAEGKQKTRISGTLLAIRDVEGGLKAPYNFDNLRKVATVNAQLETAAQAKGGITLGAQ